MGTTLDKEAADALTRLAATADDEAIAAARRRMGELFRSVKGFRLAPKIPREELYERGSLH